MAVAPFLSGRGPFSLTFLLVPTDALFRKGRLVFFLATTRAFVSFPWFPARLVIFWFFPPSGSSGASGSSSSKSADLSLFLPFSIRRTGIRPFFLSRKALAGSKQASGDHLPLTELSRGVIFLPPRGRRANIFSLPSRWLAKCSPPLFGRRPGRAVFFPFSQEGRIPFLSATKSIFSLPGRRLSSANLLGHHGPRAP